jgi:hypothetical protein
MKNRMHILRDRLRNGLKQLSTLQRGTINRIFANMMLMALISAASHFRSEYGYGAKTLVFLFALLPAIPMFAIIWLLGRYLAGESDEFVRMMVVKSLLWAAAVTVAGDMIQSALVALSSEFWSLDQGFLTIMNFDLFFIASVFSVAIQLRRYR